MLAIVILAAVLLMSTLLSAAVLLAIGKLLGAKSARFGRALLVTMVIMLLAAPFLIGMRALPDLIVLPLIGLVVISVVSIGLFQRYFDATLLRAIGIFVANMLIGGALASAIAWTLTTYAVETFVSPSNGMAPAIAGRHTVGVCPECGGEVILPANMQMHSRIGNPLGWAEEGICTHCRHIANNVAIGKPRMADMFAAEKFRAPQRFDVVTYRPPHEPGLLFVHRLVGLPGETLELRDGELRIDGAPAIYAPDMVGLSYDAANHAAFLTHLNIDGSKVTLADDEYFVLGDFATQSSDSRVFGPIKTDAVTGVVTLIYWPPTRWRVLR